MARHILYQGEIPTFYYGQSYLGPLEPLTGALSFAGFGPSVAALRLAPAAYSLAFVVLTARFAARAFGSTAGAATLAYLAVPPLFLVTWSVKARGGYSAFLALGAGMLLLTIDLHHRPHDRPWRWPALGMLAGLLLWTDPLGIVYVVPCAVYLAAICGRQLLRWTTLAAILAAVVFSLPMLLANVQSHGQTLHDLAVPNVSEPLTVSSFAAHVDETVRLSLPTLLGFYQASSERSAFVLANLARHRVVEVVDVLAGVVAVGVLALVLFSIWRVLRGKLGPIDLLAWVAACTVGLFAGSQLESLYATEPRYLLPLYSLVPVAGALFARAWASPRRPIAAMFVLGVLGLNLASVARFDPSLAAPFLAGQTVRADDPSLADFLLARGDRTLYADYWIAYPIAFQSREQIVTAVIDDQLQVGFNRYIPYAIAVDQSPDPAVVVVADSPVEQRLRAALASHGATYQVSRWRNLAVFDRIQPAFRPGR